MLGAAVIAILTFFLSQLRLSPRQSHQDRLSNRYIKDKRITYANAIQMQVAPETFMFMSYYNDESKVGYTFSMDPLRAKDFRAV